MAGELRSLTFWATTNDADHWAPQHKEAAESTDEGYSDWAFAELAETMRAAGQTFIDAHPDVFACELS